MATEFSFRVEPMGFSSTKHITCKGLSARFEIEHCVIEYMEGSPNYYRVVCICKNLQIATKIAELLKSLSPKNPI